MRGDELIPMAIQIRCAIIEERRTLRERDEIMWRRDFVSREYFVREVVLMTILDPITLMQ